ncbi:MAG: BspA family leucine-rich repeat surface protein [Chitinophagaceae bacterium]|nr:BspA family leucine-rich repeat surface protein [Chitinophagaceae bacterium]
MKQHFYSLKTLLFFVIFLLLGSSETFAQRPFITVWKTDNYGSTNANSIGFEAEGEFDYEWEEVADPDNKGSGSSEDNTVIAFPHPGIYRVFITPTGFTPFHRFHLGFDVVMESPSDSKKLLKVEQWGDVAWSTFKNAFVGCANLEITATDIPNLENVTNMTFAFSNSSVSAIPNIDYWDVSNVEDMSGMFERATEFNQSLNNWDVRNVTKMYAMFSRASSFNQPLNNWDVSSVEDMSMMFSGATAFNQPLNNWDLISVSSMWEMFKDASAFNQPLNNWDVSGVRFMKDIFLDASSFDQPLDQWSLSYIYASDGLSFSGTAMSCKNYSITLEGWANNWQTLNNVKLNADGLEYSPDIIARRDYLVNTLGWTITGDALGSCIIHNLTPLPFTGIWNTSPQIAGGRTGISMRGPKDDDNITIYATGRFNYTWEQLDDDGDETGVTGSGMGLGATTITFPDPGVYRVKLLEDDGLGDPLRRIEMGVDPDEAKKLMEIQSWGSMKWISMRNAFKGTSNLKISATDKPDLAGVTDMTGAFEGSGISSVPGMNGWDVSNVWSMNSMFRDATNFNEEINGWDVSGVTDMSFMFKGASSFNQPLESWGMSNVEMLYGMFEGATAFNQPLSGWNLRSLIHSEDNPNDISLANSGMSCDNYSALLTGLASNKNTPADIVLDAAGLSYNTDVSDSRDRLINDLGWTITGDVSGTCNSNSFPPGAFVTVWKTDNPGVTDDDQIEIYAYGEYNYTWEEIGDPANNGSGSAQDVEVITFPHPGTYRVYLMPTGDDPLNAIQYSVVDRDNEKLMEIQQWGNLPWSSLSQTFYGCFNLKITATDKPDLTNAFAMDQTFDNAGITTVPGIGDWNVSNIFSLQYTFSATEFNQSLSNWDVSNVHYLNGLFYYNQVFNQPLSNWNVSNVIQMPAAFDHATAFNQPLNNWDVSNVKNMYNIFADASSFNQPLNQWNLRSLEHQPTLPNDFSFANSGMNCENYSITLMGWAANPNTAHNIVLDATGLAYGPSAASARNYLINNLGWTITGDISGSCTVVPVRLIDFNAKADGNHTVLLWSAANEDNFKGYGIERSTNGLQWDDIGFVNAKGASGNKVDYSYYDSQVQPGVVYYRLKLTDKDGSFTYSEVKKVVFAGNVSVSVYPNPARNFVTVSGLSGKSVIKLMDITGRTLQTITAGSATEQINVSQLSKGIYNLVIISNKGVSTTRKIVKD